MSALETGAPSTQGRPGRLVVTALLAAIVGTLVLVAPAAAEAPPAFVTMWGSYGTGNGQFSDPRGLAVDGESVFVTDYYRDRVQKFNADGAYVTQWGSNGSGNGQFIRPTGIAAGGGYVYVVDENNHRIQQFTSSGAYVRQWGTYGSGNGRFNMPVDVALDDAGNVYVLDAYANLVQRFNATGQFQGQWGTGGNEPGQFYLPQSLDVDAGGNAYVTDFNHRVQRFAADGTFLDWWGGAGDGPGEFSYPSGVAVDGTGSVYVADDLNDRMQKFSSSGAFLVEWGDTGSPPGSFAGPHAVDVDGSGDLFVSEVGNHRVQRFAPGAQARPDARIRKGATGTLVGDDVYNTTGAGQTRRGSAPRGGTVTYYVSVQNDASFPDALRLKGTASTTRFQVRYSTGGTTITSAVTAGTWTTAVLAPGASQSVKVQVTVRTTAPAGSVLDATLLVKSDSDRTQRDTVRFVTSRS